jgi:hypothetical protein
MQLKYLLYASAASAAAIGRRDLPAYEKTYGILNPAVHALHQSIDAITAGNVVAQVQVVKAKARELNSIAIAEAASIKASPQLRNLADANAALTKSRASLNAFGATLTAMIKKRPVVVAAKQEGNILEAIADSKSGIFALFEATVSQVPPSVAATLKRLGKPLASKAELQKQVDDMFEAVTHAYRGHAQLNLPAGVPQISESGITTS